MNKIIRLLRYDLPLHFVLLLTNWLPDNVPFLKLRGSLASLFFKDCGRNLRLGRNLVLYNPSSISIGKNVYIAYGTWMSAGVEITIGDEVTIGPYCVITTNDHKRIGETHFGTGVVTAPVVISNGSWLGSHCVVTSGCNVGSGSVLGAGAVCVSDIPTNVLAVGVPAKTIKIL